MDRTLKKHPLFVALFGLIGGVFLAGSASATTGFEAISPSQPEYTLGDTAVIYGLNFTPGSSVILEVIRSDGSIVTGSGTDTPGSDTVTASPTGTFTYFYLIDGASPVPFSGTLTANAKNPSTGTVLATTTFKDGTQFMLQGCSNDRGDCTLDPSPSWAGGTSPMTGWTSGNLKGWFEGDNVPYRLRIGLRDEGSAGTYYFTTEHDNMRDGVLGIDYASNFYVGYGPVGSMEGTLTKSCRLQASGPAVPTTSDPCIVTGPTYVGTGTGSSVKQIQYAWAVLFNSSEDGGNDKKWAVYWLGHLATNSHLWPGSSLHTDTTATGAQDVPISDIEERATGANLSITKADAPDPVYVGENLTYTITVTNNGPGTATNVQVSDALPTAVTYGTATASQGTCSMTGGVVTCNIGTLANGASATVTIVVTPLAAGTLSNTAIVSSDVADPDPSNNTSAPATTTVNPSANLSITKTASPNPVLAGQYLTYTIVVTNNGPSSASSVTMTDTLPANATFVSVTPGSPTCAGTTTVTCTLGTMTSGQSATIWIVVTPTAAAATAGSLTNTATVASPTHDPTSGNNSSSTTTTVNPGANLSIIKSDAPDPVYAGQNLTYTLTVANAGPSTATGVTVTDPLPANVTFVSASWTGASTGTCSSAVSCNLGTLTNGQSVTITIVVTPTAAAVGTLTNTATVSSSVGDPVSSNNTSTTTTTVNPSANLSIMKTASPNPVLAGQNLTYTLAVANAGPSAATGVTVTDTLPATVTFVSASWTGASTGTCSSAVSCNLGTLASGASVTITIVVTPTAAAVGTLSNTASVSSPTNDPNTSNNTSATSTTVNPGADLSITKTGAASVTVGQNLTYTIVVTNNGPSSASSVTMTDPLPAGVTFVSVTPNSPTCTQASGTVNCNLGTMTSGQSTTITIVVTPTATGTLNNTATVSSPTGDPTPGDHTTPPVTTTVTATSADLSITKTASASSVTVGQNLTYTLTAYNAGPNSATGVTVTDTLPAGVNLVSASASPGPCTGTTTVSCSLGTLGSGASGSATIVVQTTAAAVPSITNTASVSSGVGDPVPGNNTSSVTTTVNPAPAASADLAVTKTDLGYDPIAVGLDVIYTMTVTNNGPDTATVVTLKDTLPSSVTFVSATPSQGSCNPPSGGVVTCNLGSLTNGASATVNVKVKTTTAGMIANTAEVINLTESDPNLANNSATETTNVGDVSRLINISTRGFVGTNGNAMVGGFILGGNLPKQLLLRGFGPTLTSFGVTGVLANPTFELFWDDDNNSTTPAVLLATNDDWGTPVTVCNAPATCGTPTEIEATGMSANSYAPTNSNRGRDAALLVTLPPGTYTVRMTGVNNGTGVGLVGVDDPDTSTLPKLVNISTRGRVETQIPMIGGFIIGAGTGSKTVLLRGFGPTLTSFGLTGVLANPTFELFWDNDGSPTTPAVLLATNDDWGTPVTVCNAPAICGTPAAIEATGMSANSYAPTNTNRALDAAILVTLPPGLYTVRMTGVGNTSGVALVGIDELGQ